jgi:aquaporin Z
LRTILDVSRQPGSEFSDVRDESWSPGARRVVAEALGAFGLTAVAAGADVAASLTGGEVTPFARAIAPGLFVMASIYAMGDVSGMHINPVVTLGFTLKRLFPVRWLPAYWLAQLIGATCAGLGLVILLGSGAAQAGVNAPHVPALTAVAIEAFLTYILVSIILGTADRAHLVGSNAALAVGATIVLCGLISLPLEGASMNPARSTGPALATLQLQDLWIYWAGPIVGAVLAVLLTTYIHGTREQNVETRKAAQGERR